MAEFGGVPTVVEYPGPYRTGTYAAVCLASLAKVLEGSCPTCGGQLRPSTGLCWECRVNWAAERDETGSTIYVLDGKMCLSWRLEAARPERGWPPAKAV